MSDLRDPAIKLFGRTIPLSDSDTQAEGATDGATAAAPPPPAEEPDKSTCEEETKETETADTNPGPSMDTVHANPNPSSSSTSSLSNQNKDNGNSESEPMEESSRSSKSDKNSQEKTLKKPDKILPCPRCNSMDTKFCYYNNYNVNQPRHFCKNCQRYWTAGGTMRNVPVGAGRRKNKQSSHHIIASPADTTSDLTPQVRVNNTSGNLVKVGPEMPLCESMSSVLNIRDRESSVTVSNCAENGLPSKENSNSFTPPMQNLPFYPPPAPFVYPWTVYPPAVPFPLVPASFWAFMPNGMWPPTPWPGPPPVTNQNLPAGGSSPTLGKHCRDGSSSSGSVKGGGEEGEKTEKSLWVPKTLRIDDPEEAAKSSIWATLGIKPEEGGIFRPFRGISGNNKGQPSDPARALRANPAALSRSQSFQEIS